MRGRSYSTVAQNHQDSSTEPSDYKIWGDTVFASVKEGQISVLMQEQRANIKECQQGSTVIPWVNYCSPPTVKCPLQFNFCQWLHKDVWKGYLQVFIKKEKKSCSVKWFLTACGTLESNFVAVSYWYDSCFDNKLWLSTLNICFPRTQFLKTAAFKKKKKSN